MTTLCIRFLLIVVIPEQAKDVQDVEKIEVSKFAAPKGLGTDLDVPECVKTEVEKVGKTYVSKVTPTDVLQANNEIIIIDSNSSSSAKSNSSSSADVTPPKSDYNER
ncbi:hypothetical protein Tco_1540730 [Tanacetum coccineum]